MAGRDTEQGWCKMLGDCGLTPRRCHACLGMGGAAETCKTSNLAKTTNFKLRKKCKRKFGKQENRGKEKTELQEQNRALTPRRHYLRLGVAKQASTLSPIQHSTPRHDGRRLGVDRAARELALHQGLNA
ncbi:hypothetical protein PIB30_095683 [Stylosanthes scabra]|uniref:Uncharacterized protein n=1 Tax=Stylosanthes scabra TaxID=79078 RepID=A0ABU6UXK0_9FABA|nr:hypothetical protein [Stylosanthes scabra]